MVSSSLLVRASADFQNDTFGSTSNLLSGTFTRMNAMARRQGSSWCYFMLFLLFVVWLFVVLWWWRR